MDSARALSPAMANASAASMVDALTVGIKLHASAAACRASAGFP